MTILLALWLLVHVCVMLVVGLADDVRPADAAVVYGNQINSDGSPSPRLRARLDRTIELYNKKLFPIVIVSGAIDGRNLNEAASMARYLEANGIPRSSIIEDSTGWTTFYTARNLVALSNQHGIKTVLVVSQYYHILRIMLSLHRAGFTDVRHAHARMAPEARDFYYVPREVAGFYYYLFRKPYPEIPCSKI